MSDQPSHGDHGSDHRHDVDDQRTEDQAEDPVHDVGLHRVHVGPYYFDLCFEAQFGFAYLCLQLAAYLVEISLGRERGAFGPFLHGRDHGLGLRIGEASLAQPFLRLSAYRLPLQVTIAGAARARNRGT